jgi:hypothetical protein
MTNPNNHEKYRSENRQESYTDANGETHTHVRRTTETVNNTPNTNSYGSGYVSGRENERRYQQANLAERDNSNTANGLLLGVILTSLATLGVGAFWYFNQRSNPAVDNTVPVVVPVPTNASPSPEATQSPQQRTTIIERTREVPVVIPQPQAPATSAPAQPNINVTVPPQPPAREKAQPNINVTVPPQPPAREKVPTPSPQSPTSKSPAQDRNSDTSTTTPLQGVDKSNTNSSNGTSSSENSNTGDSTP